jgi:hypothetical protein
MMLNAGAAVSSFPVACPLAMHDFDARAGPHDLRQDLYFSREINSASPVSIFPFSLLEDVQMPLRGLDFSFFIKERIPECFHSLKTLNLAHFS